MNPQDMKTYYNQRATEYERVYQKPERQEDLYKLGLLLKDRLRGHRVLEVACGTGYWTQVLAETAQFILASDQSHETLEIARSKGLRSDKFIFAQDDAYTLEKSHGDFTAGFAGFWWSHIPRNKIRKFLLKFHERVSPGSTVIFIDNEFQEGNSMPISRMDEEGNTYQIRTLSNGSQHEVLKNFPTDQEFKEALQGLGKNIEVIRSRYYWMLEYKT